MEIYMITQNTVQVVLKLWVLGRIPIYNSIICALDVTDNSYQIKVVSAQIGRIPLPIILHNVVIARIAPLFAGNQEIEYLRQNAGKVEIIENQLSITMKAIVTSHKITSQNRK